MSNYKHSRKRLVLLLAQFAMLTYTIFNGDERAQILAILLLPLWLYSCKTWFKKEL